MQYANKNTVKDPGHHLVENKLLQSACSGDIQRQNILQHCVHAKYAAPHVLKNPQVSMQISVAGAY